MTATLDLPIDLSRFAPEEIAWLAAKSSQTSKPVDQIARELVREAAARDGFTTPKKEGAK